MKLETLQPVGTIRAWDLCSADCCGSRAVFRLTGPGAALSGPARGTYFACEGGDPYQEGSESHLHRLVSNMLRDMPSTRVTVERIT